MSSVLAERNRNSSVAEHHTGPYVIRTLLTDVALSEDGQETDLYITCVDFWNGNLYVGSSAGEVLHYVLIPGGNEPDQEAQFILATRLQLSPTDGSGSISGQPGVQQILLLPSTDKVCIVCNGSLTFYSLPELSPLFTTTKLSNCLWVGGLDQDEEESGLSNGREVVIMVCQKSRIRLVRIGERLRGVREIEIKGCSSIARRGNIACIADNNSYSLLDVVEKQRISLFDIASQVEEIREDAISPVPEKETQQAMPSAVNHPENPELLNNPTTESNTPQIQAESENTQPIENANLTVESTGGEFPPRRSSLQFQPSSTSLIPEQTSLKVSSQSSGGESNAETTISVQKQKLHHTKQQIRPHIVSPTANEFLLTTGTTMDDPGVGMFVNLDGDVVRGTLEFSRYPEALCIDSVNRGSQISGGQQSTSGEDFALAIVSREVDDKSLKSLEIQGIDSQMSDSGTSKYWLDFEHSTSDTQPAEDQKQSMKMGIRSSVSSCEVVNLQVSHILVLKRLVLADFAENSENLNLHDKAAQKDSRDRSEAQFVKRLSNVQAQIIIWVENRIWWAIRNPTIVRLDAQLSSAVLVSEEHKNNQTNRRLIEQTMKEVQNREPQTELDFLGFKYIRQRASLLLFTNIISNQLTNLATNEHELRVTEEALTEGEVDPRLVLAILPNLRNEVVEGKPGIWTQNGLKELIEDFVRYHDLRHDSNPRNKLGDDILHLVRRYLQTWRRKKGFGSIADEREVFETVDAGLVYVLLVLDRDSPQGPISKGSKSIRAELYTVVDHGVDCFERAIELLEEFHRLYVLSRLYQSRKMSNRVLETWRRIIEGEQDSGGELVDGEQEVARYLSKISDVALVEEYGAWLAARNPKLGVRVFTDNANKVKISPSRVVELLKAGAPNTVRIFLEHLVFDKNLASYANDLISYYLDSVLLELESSDSARSSIHATYASYRALRPPKPPYSQFASDNAVDAAWYHDRLRLLQLLGGSHGAASQYDISGILARIEPFEQELVPEMIVLSGRQGKHKEAIRLLTHGLGDFDTAVSYCVLGGSSTYSPLSGSMPKDSIPSREEQMGLFQYLLEEFLRIEDYHDRMMQTSELLERFAGWFDVSHVLTLIPESWSLDLLSSFLESALRQLVTEQNEALVIRALTSVENLTTSVTLIEKIDSFGPKVETVSAAQGAT